MLKDKKFWFCVVGIVGLGFLVGLLSGDLGEYYASLQKPFFAPPGWLFGPVWTVLYAMIGICLYTLLELKNGKDKNNLLTIFWIQLICNLLWTISFFNLKANWLAVIDITLLAVLLTRFLYLLWHKKKISFYLLVPYYLWVLFAMLLNCGIIVVN